MARLRTFLAVKASADIQQRACQLMDELKKVDAKVKWVDETQLHWTLKFIGEVRNEETSNICQAAVAATMSFEPFEIEVVGAGAFGPKKSPHILWLGMKQGAEQMIQLHDRLDDNLYLLGYRAEQRRYQPHLTLGRVSRTGDPIDDLVAVIDKNQDFLAGKMKVEEVILFSSQLTKSGPIYQRIGTAPLRKY